MNNRITRAFQGLTLTTFSMAVYNTINGIKSRSNTESQQEALKSLNSTVENQQTLINKGTKAVLDKLELLEKQKSIISESHVETIKKAGEAHMNEVNEFQGISQRFSNPENFKGISTDDVLKQLENLTEKVNSVSNSAQKTVETLNKILEEISKGGSGSGSGSQSQYLSDISNFLNSLNFEQTVAIVNMTGCVAIIISLISLIIIFYGNILIDYLQLEKRFPRIARFIQWRRKFQMYYSIIDFILIFTVASTIIYINLLIYVQ